MSFSVKPAIKSAYRKSTLSLAVTASVFSGLVTAEIQAEKPRLVMEEVIVSARRKDESMQSVPVSIAAFDESKLKEKSINTTQDLQAAVPGIFLTGSGSRTNTLYAIRGQSRPVTGQGAPGVVSYFQDVPLPVQASSVPQYDMASIQVLKGPQGTLFGRNTTGGAILTYSAKPNFDGVSGYVTAKGGDYSYSSAEGAINVPLIDDVLALRLAGQRQQRDGYTENIGEGGNDQDQLNTKSLRATLLFEPSDSLTNLTTIDYHKNDSSTSGAVLIDGIAIPAQTGFFRFDLLADAQNARGPRKVDLNGPSEEFSELFGFTNRTDADFKNFSITNIVGYRTADYFIDSQIDGMAGVPLTMNANDPASAIFFTVPLKVLEGHRKEQSKQLTEEFHIKGSAVDDKLEWLLGAFYLKSEPDDVQASATGFFQPATQSYVFIEEESKALFVNLSYDLAEVTDGLSFNFGLRQTWDESTLCTGKGEQPDLNGPVEARITDCTLLTNFSRQTAKSDEKTWTIGFDWQINDDQFAYITSRKGYRAAGLNAPKLGSGLAPFQEFDPETTTDVELGYRADWQISDILGRFNIAIFDSIADDVQLTYAGFDTTTWEGTNGTCDPVTNPFVDGDCNLLNDPTQGIMTTNVGETEIRGVELELQVKPTDNLTLGLVGTYQDSKTRDYTVPVLFQPYNSRTEIPILYTPKSTLAASVRYQLPLDDSIGEVVLNADYYYSDEVEMIAYTADSYNISSARVSWNQVMGSSFDVALQVRNVFDQEAEVAPAVLNALAPFKTVIYNEPRMWAVEVTYHFDD